MLQLKLFGSPQIHYQGQALTGFVSAKVRALLIYLAVTGRPHSRDHLAELLWADTPASTRANLRKALSNLRQLIGNTLVEDAKESIALNGAQVWVDVVEFGRLIKGGADQEAVTLYQADFLTGFNLSLSYEFEAWALSEQSRLKTQMVDLLRHLATQQEANSKRSEAISTVRRLLNLEPWHEEHHRWLMELLAKDGQRSAALAHFEVCKRVLKEELAVVPSAETIALYEQLQQEIFNEDSAKTKAIKRKANSVTTPHNLPAELTPFIGRTAQLAPLSERLQHERLITLLGPPGVGKTRLAIHIAHRLVDKFQHGIYFVPLASVRDAAVAPLVTCRVLGLQESGLTALERLILYIDKKHLMLILDNFEQLLAPPFDDQEESLLWINELLASCPNLHLLVTSRAPLRLRVEQQYMVHPLELPAPAKVLGFEQLATTPSIQLFTERAKATCSDFAVTPQNIAAIADLCIRLDGLPLAIELIAARIKMFSPQLLLARLDRRLLLNSNGLRDSASHQQTLAHAIQWSYDLLNNNEQRLFAQLALFAGGFTVEAVEAICIDRKGFHIDALTALASLLDKSLITQQSSEQGNRFSMLALIREFALERLEASNELDLLRKAHAQYYLHFAEKADSYLRSAEQLSWFSQLEEEHHNLRAALEWSVSIHGDPIDGFRFVKALDWFWFVRCYYSEGIRWIRRLLETVEKPVPILHQAWAWSTASKLATGLDEIEQGIAWSNQALRVAQEWNEFDMQIHVIPSLVTHLFCRGEIQRAKEIVQETIAQLDMANSDAWTVANMHYLSFRVSEDAWQLGEFFQQGKQLSDQSGDRWLIGIYYCLAERLAAEAGDVASAQAKAQQYYQVATELQDGRMLLFALNGLGDYAYKEGKLDDAEQYFQQALAKATQLGTPGAIAVALRYQGYIAYQRGKQTEALTYYEQALNWVKDLKFNLAVACLLPPIARIVEGSGYPLEAMRLLGATNAIYPVTEFYGDPDIQPILADAQTKLDDPICADAWAEGNQMSMEQAVHYTLSLIPVILHSLTKCHTNYV
jgi:predicted ATPase/DNA-binding SARP family transcriptional activator